MRARSAAAARRLATRVATAAVAVATVAALAGMQPAPHPAPQFPAAAASASAGAGYAARAGERPGPAAHRTPHVPPPQLVRGAAHKSAGGTDAALFAPGAVAGPSRLAGVATTLATAWTLRYDARASRTRGQPLSAS